jgi:hypothetical protein
MKNIKSKPIEKEKQIKLQNFIDELMIFLINNDFKLLINEYLSDIKNDLPDDIFDSEREVIHNFYLWVKKKYR